MLKQLQRKLTFLYTLTTSLILTLAVIFAAIINLISMQRHIKEVFETHMIDISTRVRTDGTFLNTWLATTEANSNLIIHIEENGVPLLYQGSWTPKTDRSQLIERAKEEARKQNTDLSVKPLTAASVSPVFTFSGAHKDKYLGIAMLYPDKKGYKSLLLLFYVSPFYEILFRQGLLFLLADLLGIFALWAVIRKFVAYSIKPLVLSTQKQSEFIAAASHELRSPLMVVQSCAQAIEASPERRAGFTENILKECKRMARLIQDMQLLASFDMKNWSVHLQTIDPNTLILDLFELYEPVCLEKRVSLKLELSENICHPILGDEERLLQLFTILMDNALSYNRENKPVTIRGFEQKSCLYIEIEDHGTGIPDEQKKQIFDRFYRCDQSRKDKQHFGLGLSIAKELAELHHAGLSVKDTPGGGCTFVCQFFVKK